MKAKPKNKARHAKNMREIRNLPARAGKTDRDPKVQSKLKRNAVGVMTSIQEVIRGGGARPKLSTVTVGLKQHRGYSRVRTPLMGSSGANNMLSGLVVVKIEGGWKCTVQGRHHSGKSQLFIWRLHELGFTSRRSPRFVRFLHSIGIHVRAAGVFRVPGRHPFKRGMNRFLRSAKKRTSEQEIRDAVTARIVPIRIR